MKIGGKIIIALAILALLMVPLAACEGMGEKGDKGTTGATGATGATGPAGATGARGPAGSPGEPGADGTPGTAGAPGSMWYTGSGIPAAGTGADFQAFRQRARSRVAARAGSHDGGPEPVTATTRTQSLASILQ